MGYSVYLFDFDYTLANAEAGIMMCYRAVLKRHGCPDVPDDVIKRGIGRPVTEILREITGVRDNGIIKRYAEEFSKEADVNMAANTYLLPAVLPVLSELKLRGTTTGIVSTKNRRRIMETVNKHDIEYLFDIIIGGEDVSGYKPDPEGILLAIKRLEAEKEDVLYIGDSLVDAVAAKNAGVDFAAVTTGVTAAEEFMSFPRVMIMTGLEALL